MRDSAAERGREVQPLVYSLRQVQGLLGISRSTLNKNLKRGIIQSVRLGGRRFVPRSVLHAMLEVAEQRPELDGTASRD
jgi:excisionase family DNA binding protein